MQIEKASKAALEALMGLYRSCGQHLQSQGILQWGDFYPEKKQVAQDIEQGNLYLGRLNGILCAAVTLDFVQPSGYAAVNWRYAEPAWVVHRLAVAPSFQGRGLAQQMMQFAEQQGPARGAKSIRLDTYSLNPRNLRFYERLAYERTKEVVFLGEPWTAPFLCFEKAL